MSNRVVVSLTTLPGRYEKLRRMLASVQAQTLLPHAIYLGIPLRSRRLGQEYKPLPPDIAAQVTIVRLEEDYGPVCKFLGALSHESDPDTIIVTLDDDVIYPPSHLRKIAARAAEHPLAAVAASGLILSRSGLQSFGAYHTVCRNRTFSFEIGPQGREIDVVYGFSGVGYRRNFFGEGLEEDLLRHSREKHALFMNDDVLVSGYLERRGVKRMVFSDFDRIDYTGLGAEETDISYHRLRMIWRMQRAVELCKGLGMFKTTSPLAPLEDLNQKTLFLALLVVLLIILGIAAVAVFAR